MVSGYRAYCPYTIGPDASGQWKAPDLGQAESLVKASGTKGQPIVVWAFCDYVAEARYVVALLNRLGYKASLHYVPNDAAYFAELEKAPAAQAGMFGWFGNVLAVDALAAIGCDFDPNPAHFCDRSVDAQLRELANDEPADPAGTAGRAEARSGAARSAVGAVARSTAQHIPAPRRRGRLLIGAPLGRGPPGPPSPSAKRHTLNRYLTPGTEP